MDFACTCAPCVYIAHRNQKRASDTLDLELPMAVGCHVGAGSRPQSTGRAAKATTTKQSPQHLLFL